jgi:osmotically-inducible protein OsmY
MSAWDEAGPRSRVGRDLSDFRLEVEVRGEVARDPRVDDAEAIAVAVDAGFVTLRGTVATHKDRRAVVRAARRCGGVTGIGDRLQVRVTARRGSGDAELRASALQALIDEPELTADELDVRVNDGWITLTGHVTHQRQSDVAFRAVAALDHVKGIANEIVTSTVPRTRRGRGLAN